MRETRRVRNTTKTDQTEAHHAWRFCSMSGWDHPRTVTRAVTTRPPNREARRGHSDGPPTRHVRLHWPPFQGPATARRSSVRPRRRRPPARTNIATKSTADAWNGPRVRNVDSGPHAGNNTSGNEHIVLNLSFCS